MATDGEKNRRVILVPCIVLQASCFSMLSRCLFTHTNGSTARFTIFAETPLAVLCWSTFNEGTSEKGTHASAVVDISWVGLPMVLVLVVSMVLATADT